MNVRPDNIFWTDKPFATKLGMVMYHQEPDCLPKRLVCCLQGQGHSKGSFNQNVTFYLLNCWSLYNQTASSYFGTKMRVRYCLIQVCSVFWIISNVMDHLSHDLIFYSKTAVTCPILCTILCKQKRVKQGKKGCSKVLLRAHFLIHWLSLCIFSKDQERERANRSDRQRNRLKIWSQQCKITHNLIT